MACEKVNGSVKKYGEIGKKPEMGKALLPLESARSDANRHMAQRLIWQDFYSRVENR